MRTPSRVLVTVLALLGCPAAAATGATPSDWEKWVPETATTVLVIDAQALNGSPLATRAGWGKRHAAGSPADVTSLPERVVTALVATDLSPRSLADSWRVAVIDLNRPATAADLAAREGGRVDSVRGQDVVVTRRDLVLVPVSPTRIVARQPADRLALGRWLSAAKDGKAGRPSPYLREAVAVATAPVVAALDLTDAIDVPSMRERLRASATMKGRGQTMADATAELLGRLKGVTLAVRVTDAIEAELRLDFDGKADAIAPVLLPLVREALQGAGADLDDLAAWTTRVEGSAGILSGKLTENSFRLAVSPFLSPASLAASHAPAAADGTDPKLAATQNYYRGLLDAVDHVRTMKGLNLDVRIKWYYEAAHKIDALPMLNIDPDVLTFGASVSVTLRTLAETIANYHNRGVIIGQNATKAVAQTGYASGYAGGFNRFGNPVGVGYSAPTYGVVNNYAQINNMLAVNAASEGAMQAETWKNIESAFQDMRRKLTTKYQIEFPALGEPEGKKK